MRSITWLGTAVILYGCFSCFGFRNLAVAANPNRPTSLGQRVNLGRQLFTRQWAAEQQSKSVGARSANHTSCAGCHNQGGIGGGGDADANAVTLGVESMRVQRLGPTEGDPQLKALISQLHPGLVQANGQVASTMTLHSRGGSPLQHAARQRLLRANDPTGKLSGKGNTPDAIRRRNSRPIDFQYSDNNGTIQIRARLQQRNTPSIFGAGLIERIPKSAILQQVKLQQRHPTVSGRVSVLTDGRIGRFGWRGTTASLADFSNAAMTGELGLRTASSMGLRENPNRDTGGLRPEISDAEILAVRDFMASLPAPQPVIPRMEDEKQLVLTGQKAFVAAGCAVCHTPNMGPAKGIFSDLLLHDMGPNFVDYTNPMPDIAEVNESVSIDLEIIPDLVRPIRIGYYGMGPALNFSVGGSGTLTAVPTVSEYDANRQSEFFLISEKKAQLQDGREEARARDNAVADIARIARRTRGGAAGRQTGLSMAKLAFERPVLTVRKIGRVRPTNLCREFRTPPLWGVASTAPYMHDGRCDTLMDAILMHEGEAEASQRSFTGMPRADQEAIIAFLNTFEIQDPQQ